MTARRARDERVKLSAVLPKTGLTVRGLQAIAQRGEIPGAAKIGRVWTFDLKQFEEWIAEQVEAAKEGACPKERDPGISLGATASRTGASRLPARTNESAYTRAIGKKRSAA